MVVVLPGHFQGKGAQRNPTTSTLSINVSFLQSIAALFVRMWGGLRGRHRLSEGLNEKDGSELRASRGLRKGHHVEFFTVAKILEKPSCILTKSEISRSSIFKIVEFKINNFPPTSVFPLSLLSR